MKYLFDASEVSLGGGIWKWLGEFECGIEEFLGHAALSGDGEANGWHERTLITLSSYLGSICMDYSDLVRYLQGSRESQSVSNVLVRCTLWLYVHGFHGAFERSNVMLVSSWLFKHPKAKSLSQKSIVDKGRPLCLVANGARHAVSWFFGVGISGPNWRFLCLLMTLCNAFERTVLCLTRWMAVSGWAFDLGMPQIFGSASCTRLLWSIHDFSWIHNMDRNLEISFIWSKTVRKSILVVVCCSPCACHSCQWGLPKVSRFGSISNFLGSRAFEYCIYYIEITNSWSLSNSFCLRTVECSLCECWCTSGLFYILHLVVMRSFWSICDFYGFIVSISMFRYRLFGGRVCVSP